MPFSGAGDGIHRYDLGLRKDFFFGWLCACVQEEGTGREGVPEMGTKPLKLRRASQLQGGGGCWERPHFSFASAEVLRDTVLDMEDARSREATMTSVWLLNLYNMRRGEVSQPVGSHD